MKKNIARLLLVALTYLSVGGLFFSCRSIQRANVQSDSTARETTVSAQKYQREIVTEYIPTSGGLSLPTVAVPEWMPLQFVRAGPGDTVWIPGPVRIVRQTIRESGEAQQVADKKTEVKTVEKTTQKDYSPLIERGIFLLTVFLVLMGVGVLLLIYALFLRRK